MPTLQSKQSMQQFQAVALFYKMVQLLKVARWIQTITTMDTSG